MAISSRSFPRTKGKTAVSGATHSKLATRTFRQTVQLPGPPAAVYTALMTTKGHQEFTGAPARISPKVGGTFVAWGGYIHGRNLELDPGKKIVQAWRPTVEDWPETHDSVVRFVLAPSRGGTRVEFTHSKVLSQHAGHLARGWKTSYWTPLRAYLASREKVTKLPRARARSRRRN